MIRFLVFSRILLTCIAALSCYSVHLLLRSAGVVGIRAYEQLGMRAFGHPGKIVAAMSSYLFIVKSELPLVIQAFLGQTSSSDPTKRRMQNIGNVSILGMFIMYFLTATFGYLTFYGNTEAELLHTYSKVDPLDTLILCVRLAVLVAVTLTVPVVLFPIRRALLQLLFPGKPFHWLRHIAIALCLLSVVNLLVILVPNIRDIFGIT
ncbi:hypothetical protein FQN60_002176, partial [Etheostoma spectabile]